MSEQIDLTAARKLAEEAKERAEKATPGPWEAFGRGDTTDVHVLGEPESLIVNWNGFDSSDRPLRVQRTNARFIAAARTDVPALADLVTRLADALEQADDSRELFAATEADNYAYLMQLSTRLAAAEAENERLRGKLTS